VKRNPCGYAKWNKYITGHNRRGCKNGENQKKAASLAHKGIPLNISEEVEKERRRKIGLSSRGIKHSQEFKDKISKAIKNKYDTDQEFRELHNRAARDMGIKNKGHVAWSKGLTKETHPSIKSISLKLIERYKDVNNCPAWQGGKSYEPYSRDFNSRLKHRIKERDNYSCRECDNKIKNQDLHVHHIDYDKMNNNENNLITLCNSCHAKTTKKNARSFYKMYYKYKVGKDTNYFLNKFSQLNII